MYTSYVRVVDLTYPTCIWCPHWRLSGSNFAKFFGIRKWVPGLWYGIVCMILCLAILRQYRCVTDGWTDTWQQHV